MSSRHFLNVLTAKGLAYLVRHHKHDLDLQHQVKLELARRKVRNDGMIEVPERAVDGYERDR